MARGSEERERLRRALLRTFERQPRRNIEVLVGKASKFIDEFGRFGNVKVGPLRQLLTRFKEIGRGKPKFARVGIKG